jgi:elongation factor 1-gamma
MSFFNSEVIPKIGGYFQPIIGKEPYNRKNVEDSLAGVYKAIDVVEKHLLINTFLVGERLTLADIFAAGIAQRGFQYIFDKKWRSSNPNVTRWFETVANQPIYKDVMPDVIYTDEILKNVAPKSDAPKKEKAPAAPKAAPKPKAPEPEEEEEDKPAPKPKHPLEELGKPTLILDDWKRKYSNEDTRSAALPWFWENYKPDEYSLWQVDYKYNDELTQTFMTSNLIGE